MFLFEFVFIISFVDSFLSISFLGNVWNCLYSESFDRNLFKLSIKGIITSADVCFEQVFTNLEDFMKID